MGEWFWPGENPIVRSAIGIDFGQLFSPSVVSDASSHHQALKSILPRRQAQQAVVVQVGQGAGPTPMVQAPQQSGVVFDQTDSGGQTVKALSMQGTSLIFSSTRYSRWKQVWAEAEIVFRELLPTVEAVGNLPVSATLEYANRFFWSGEPDSAVYGSLLAKGLYLAPNVFTLRGFWHNFHGFFREDDDPSMGRHLENINVSVSDQSDPTSEARPLRRCVDVTVNHRFDFVVPTSLIAGILDRPGAVDIGQLTTGMHERNKEILRNVVTSAIVSRIDGLGRP